MKIILDAAFVSQDAVGISRYLRCLAPTLARISDLTILTSAPRAFADAGCAIAEIPRWTADPRRRLAWTMVGLNRLARQPESVLLCPTCEVPPFPHIPVISILHDLIPLMLRRQHSSRYKSLNYLRLLTLHWASAVITDSRSTRDDLLSMHVVDPQRVVVVPPGPGLTPQSTGCRAPADEASDEPEPDLENTMRRGFLLYVGGHSVHKNVPRLIAAFARSNLPKNTELLLIGWGTERDRQRTKRAIDRTGLGSRVTMLDRLSDRQLSRLYSTCRAFVFPSLYEGFGFPVIEALSHGAPVACSRTTSLPDVADNAAVYFDPRSVDDMARAIREIALENPARETLSKRGIAVARRFSWESTASAILQIARRLRSQSKSGIAE